MKIYLYDFAEIIYCNNSLDGIFDNIFNENVCVIELQSYKIDSFLRHFRTGTIICKEYPEIRLKDNEAHITDICLKNILYFNKSFCFYSFEKFSEKQIKKLQQTFCNMIKDK
jgi:hypothetical protein